MYKTSYLLPKIKIKFHITNQTEEISLLIDEHINSYAKEGWELVSIASLGTIGGFVFVWKKP